MNNIERELKMDLTQTEYETLLSLTDAQPQLQVNCYFRFVDMPLDIMLRIREKGGKYMFCYKRLLSAANGVNVCDEREVELDKETAERMLADGLTPADVKKLVDVDLPQACECIGSLSTYRTKFMLDRWLIELDKNEYLNTVDYELECECGSDELLGKLKDYLYYNYGMVFKRSLSKSMRFLLEYYCDG